MSSVKILFVCHGNICRSTMAQYVMQDIIERRGLGGSFVIDSAACRNDEVGSPVHPGTREVLELQGIACGDHRAREVATIDAEAWDMIIGMDAENMCDLKRLLPASAQHKCFKLLDFAGIDRDVADPWYTGDFAATFDDVVVGCRALLASIGIR